MPKSVSLLLGAGFSAPMGYPIGNQLNETLLACDGTEFGFHTEGVITVDSRTGGRPNFGYQTSYDDAFDFCRALIKYYDETIAKFDYEEFYDYLLEKAPVDKGLDHLAKPFLSQFASTSSLINQLPNIYNQMVSFYLKDGESNGWHDNEAFYCKPLFAGYTGILNCLENWGSNGLVNVHTLNHDLFFERLANTQWLDGELSDGFEELGSPYYGSLLVDGRSYKVRLKYFTDKYDQKFRLYKLHGSKDYGIFYSGDRGILFPQTYVKTRYGVGFGKFYKEITNKHGQLEYEDCWVNYHADYLTGTTSKIERYKEPLLYHKLFNYFRQNLENADKLVIIGYGGKDSEVNKLLLKHFDYSSKPSFIIDPFPGKQVQELKEQLGAKLITTFLDNLSIQDFQ